MQEFLIIFLSIFWGNLFVGCASGQLTPHLKSLREEFPYGLIGEDYSILNRDDLAINTCNVEEVERFPPKDLSPYPYWQCYPVKDVTMICHDSGYDSDEKSIMAILDLQVRSSQGNHDYLTRRAIRLEDCRYFQYQFKKITQDESYICASGEYWSGPEDNRKWNHGMTWSFDKFKTKKGCVSYFADQCDLSAQLKNGCQPLSMRP